MNILIQCGDHLENQNRIMTLASTLRDFGCKPVVLLYSNKKGRYFENAGIETIALEDHLPKIPVAAGTKIESSLEDGITYDDVLQPEQRRRPRVGWPGQRARSINDIHKHHSALTSIIETCKPDHIVVWNGFTGYVANILRLIAQARNIPSAFLERGLLKNSLFIDRDGVNGASSLNGLTPDLVDALSVSEQERNKVIELFNIPALQPQQEQNTQNILFPLQVQLDTNIIMYSSYRTMRETFFDIYDALDSKTSQFLVRPHPEELPETLPNIPNHDNVRVTKSETLDHWLDWSTLVVTINSTVGLEALIKGKKVISLGNSIYSSAGLTSGLTTDLGLSAPDLRERLIKYLVYLTRSNLLIPDDDNNPAVVSKQINITAKQIAAPERPCNKPIATERAIIEIAAPLNTTLDLTYRKNKVKLDHAWILSIAKQHISAKTYSIVPYCPNSKHATTTTALKVVSEERSTKADPRYNRTIDIYGNLVR
ncbi:hypothetical protein [Pseudomonas sp. NPDC089396]|uniref:capsular polysaccharide export protein, LipB/KpsS family n=1 Tax=Pseudomonas sp. NPDC089396 TaxID=3364461 RepID=UPI00383315C8